ncbi:MAG: thymidylate kinase [Candidatus Electronema aureum]|jgi:dTMP kinase|uniref:Thymidylate kinase n=1 Tax=Candidatus Electronema aureum TaxID=2005002 RepID=A0A521FZP3_9BACT|nr:MAG: thymidylate kinase [Candidatus Electronema aureum]
MKRGRKGLLIAFEGIDGTGKSTQIQLLADFLREKGEQVVVTREPTDSVYGRRIRELYVNRDSCTPEEELELFIQDRRLHVRELIRPELAAGRIVLTDRYYYSTAAYQGAVGMDTADIFARNRFAPRPDIVFLLTMPPNLSAERICKGRGEQLNAFEQLDLLQKTAALFASFSDPWICRLDASQAVASVQKQIENALTELLSV